MKKYNLENYIRYKEDVKDKISMLPTVTNGDYTKLTDEELIIMFLPLVENVARKFSTSLGRYRSPHLQESQREIGRAHV